MLFVCEFDLDWSFFGNIGMLFFGGRYGVVLFFFGCGMLILEFFVGYLGCCCVFEGRLVGGFGVGWLGIRLVFLIGGVGFLGIGGGV